MNMTLKGIPSSIHRKLKISAKNHGRSLNKEIITILQDRFLPSPISQQPLLERIRLRRKNLKIHLSQPTLEKMIEEGRE